MYFRYTIIICILFCIHISLANYIQIQTIFILNRWHVLLILLSFSIASFALVFAICIFSLNEMLPFENSYEKQKWKITELLCKHKQHKNDTMIKSLLIRKPCQFLSTQISQSCFFYSLFLSRDSSFLFRCIPIILLKMLDFFYRLHILNINICHFINNNTRVDEPTDLFWTCFFNDKKKLTSKMNIIFQLGTFNVYL